jgi:hydrogenase-4 component F
VDGRPRTGPKDTRSRFTETPGVIGPPLLLLGLSLWLGLSTPAVLHDAWSAAVAQLFPAP